MTSLEVLPEPLDVLVQDQVLVQPEDAMDLVQVLLDHWQPDLEAQRLHH